MVSVLSNQIDDFALIFGQMFGLATQEATHTQQITRPISLMAHTKIVENFGHFRGMKSDIMMFQHPLIMCSKKLTKQNFSMWRTPKVAPHFL